VVFVLELKWAAASADLQIAAVLAFCFHIFVFAYALCEGAVPDFLPRVAEDIAESLEVALAGVYVAVGSDAGVDGCGGAAFNA
jgi:hypothetical protein